MLSLLRLTDVCEGEGKERGGDRGRELYMLSIVYLFLYRLT